MTKPLLIEHDDGVDRVTLNRPQNINALDAPLIEALNAYFESLQRNRSTRVVVLKGAATSFCAGLDLKQAMARRTGSRSRRRHRVAGPAAPDRRHRDADARCPQPIIALVQGAAAGGGFALALAADIRIAARSARMNCAFINLGSAAATSAPAIFCRGWSGCRWPPN